MGNPTGFSDSPPGSVGGCLVCECHDEMEKLEKREAELKEVQNDMQLAAATYDPNAPLPDGYRRASTAELQELGLHDGTSSLTRMEGGDFQAEVFVHQDAAGVDNYKVAFRGTQTGADWKTNLGQGAGFQSAYYSQAAEIARNAEAVAPGRVSYTGHSLGGGLASAAAGVNGSPARTFNAAGLHENTIAEYGGNFGATDAYYLTSDPLNTLQDNVGMAPVAAGTRHAYDKVHNWTDADLQPVKDWAQKDYAWWEHAIGRPGREGVVAGGKAAANRALRFHGTDELGDAVAQEQADIAAQKEALKRGACKDVL